MRKWVLITGVLLMQQAYAQKLTQWTTAESKKVNKKVLSYDLAEFQNLPKDSLVLYEVVGDKKTPIAFQLDHFGGDQIWWRSSGNEVPENYELWKSKNESPLGDNSEISVSSNGDELKLVFNDVPLVTYRYTTMYPPEGVDTVFKRSGFIHPLRSLSGKRLTRIQPSDHYHHYGLWNPWTKVEYKGEIVDFWNLKKKEGTVEFAGITGINQGAVFSGYQVHHKHQLFDEHMNKETVLNELQTVRIYTPEDDADYYIMDMYIQLECATDYPFILKEYRYGGLTIRTTEKWVKETSRVITNETDVRNEIDGSRGDWILIEGHDNQQWAGVGIMSNPHNFNHPQPLRVWPDNANGNGEIMANYAPSKDRDWVLEPGKTYHLKYRFFIFDGEKGREFMDSQWEKYKSANE